MPWPPDPFMTHAARLSPGEEPNVPPEEDQEMKSGSWSSWQAALPPEARIGGERDDEPIPPAPLDVSRWNELLTLSGQGILAPEEQAELSAIEEAARAQQPDQADY